MSFHHSPKIITDNLYFYIDPKNTNSYPGSGTIAYDLSGNGRNFTLLNGASVSNGEFILDGAGDYLTLAAAIDWNNYNFTWSAWFYLDTFNYPRLIDFSPAGNGHLCLSAQSAATIINRPAGGAGTTIISGGTLSLSTWYNITATKYDITTYEIYINGISQNTVVNSTVLANTGASINIGYMMDDDLSTRTLDGKIGPVSVYTERLNDEQVLQNYNAIKGRFGL